MTETSKFWIRNNVKNSNWWWNYRCCFLNVTINPTKWIFARQLVLPWSCIWTTVPLSGHSVRFTSLLHWSCTVCWQNQHAHIIDMFIYVNRRRGLLHERERLFELDQVDSGTRLGHFRCRQGADWEKSQKYTVRFQFVWQLLESIHMLNVGVKLLTYLCSLNYLCAGSF